MTAARYDVVGVGENSIDLVYGLPGAPGRDVKMPITGRRVSPGGQVATTLCACAAFGLRTRYVGVVGTDDNGRLVRETLHARGVDTSSVVVRDAATRYALILLDETSGERSVLWQRDAALALVPDDLPAEVIAAARLLHVDTVDEEAAIAAARIARRAGAEVTTDIDEVTARTPDLVDAATVPIFAAEVPRALTGEADPERALRALRQRHAGMLCVTLGARGAMLLAGDRLHRVPAYAIEAIDTTGAGDVFRGGLIYALLRGDRPDAMLRFANAAAAISCTREGAIGGVPRLEEVEALATKDPRTT